MAGRSFERLDGLRGVAALAVVLYHLPDPLHALAPRGYLAVDLFFLLSGFVIAAAYERKLRTGMSLGSFALIRLKRLWPLYGLGVVLGVFVFSAVRALRPETAFVFPQMPLSAAIAMSLLFLPQLALYGGPAFPFNSASWSLSVELFGNLVYARLARTLRLPMLAASSAIGLAGLALIAVRTGSLDVGVAPGDLAGGYVRFLFSFPLGVLLFRLNDRLPAVTVPAWLPLAATAFAFSGVLPDLAVTAVLFPLILIASRQGAGALHWAGALSYPVYILHPPLVAAMGALVPAPERPTASIALLAIVIGAAALANRFFDRPVQGFLRLAPA